MSISIDEINKLKEENAVLKKYIERMDKPEIQVIDAEILTLKEENAKLNAIIDSYQPRLQRYKDILNEIKSIVSNIIDGYIRPYGDYEQLKTILDLITKAEEE